MKDFRSQAQDLLEKLITRETHKGSVNRVRIQALDALVSLHEQAVLELIGEDEPAPTEYDDSYYPIQVDACNQFRAELRRQLSRLEEKHDSPQD